MANSHPAGALEQNETCCQNWPLRPTSSLFFAASQVYGFERTYCKRPAKRRPKGAVHPSDFGPGDAFGAGNGANGDDTVRTGQHTIIDARIELAKDKGLQPDEHAVLVYE